VNVVVVVLPPYSFPNLHLSRDLSDEFFTNQNSTDLLTPTTALYRREKKGQKGIEYGNPLTFLIEDRDMWRKLGRIFLAPSDLLPFSSLMCVRC
jgi:hypothetical protein